jgi:2-polyprenyl-6-methoxyphenol hydroxylase-like FAD-dependent oxidoreductase
LNMSVNETRFPFMLDIPQHETEKLLRARVGELGGRVEQNTELTTLHQDTSGVIATIKDADGESQTITADYVVGCDGAHSRVRHEIGLSFDGHAYDEDWLLADVRMGWTWREDEVHALFRSRGAPMICFPMRDSLWRIVLPYAGDRGRRAPTLEEIQQLVDERAPVRVRVSDPTWLANFRCHRRSTHEYRRGRMMLAGDAVHVHSPAGGQGMNTGIMDAHNLAWKLALVATGRAADALLDSYAEERGPVGKQVLALTHALVGMATLREPLKRKVRDVLLPVASSVPLVQRRAIRRLSQVHVSYHRSSLTRRARLSTGLRPGDRAPDLRVVVRGRDMRLYEALREKRHILLLTRGSEARCIAGFRDVTDIASCSLKGAPWLVRPDGYLAARGAADIAAYLRSIFIETDGAHARWTAEAGYQSRDGTITCNASGTLSKTTLFMDSSSPSSWTSEFDSPSMRTRRVL